MQVHLPESIHAAGSQIAEIQRCRATSPHGLTFVEKGSELTDDGIENVAHVIRESGHQQCGGKWGHVGNCKFFAIPKRSRSLSSAEHLVAYRVVDDATNH